MRKLTWAPAILLLAACGSSPGEQANDLIEKSNEIFAKVCECADELFQETVTECVDDNIEDLENVECLDQAYGLNESASEAVLDCLEQVLDSLDRCIDSADTCTEQAICLEEADDASDLCPELPDAVDDALDRCS